MIQQRNHTPKIVIDYIKILIKDADNKSLLNNSDLDFVRSISETTGECETKKVSTYHHCKIRIYDSGTVIFSGSLHKLYNSIKGIQSPNKDPNGYNGNELYFNDIDYIKKHLITLFAVSPEQMIVQNIEFGQNLNTSFDPQDFITWLLLFEKKRFEFRYNEYYAQSIHAQYILKTYNKGNHYNMPKNTLRFEIKVLRMEHQKKIVGIKSMADIKQQSMLYAFDYLIKQLEKLIYYDKTIKIKELDKKQKGKIQEYKNSRYWSLLTPKQRFKHKEKLQQIINKNSQNLKAEILDLLIQKKEQFYRLSETPKREQFYHSSIVSNHSLSTVRICPISGLDISMQKPYSKYTLTATLKNLKKSDSKKFSEVCALLLSSTSGNTPKYEKDLISHLAKQIRNRYYNQNKFKVFGYNTKSYNNELQLNIFNLN